jgi:hypothetical protein
MRAPMNPNYQPSFARRAIARTGTIPANRPAPVRAFGECDESMS